MILIFFGPPGAGKGTQAKFIAKKLNIVHLSTGDILREILSQKSELSNKLNKIMNSGQLVSDIILNEIVSERINRADCQNGFLLDGYPRTMDQAIFLDKNLQKNNLKINYIIDFIIDDETIMQRIKSRSFTENRNDDNEDVIKTRIKKYQNETKPISEFYKKKYVSEYIIIDATLGIEKLNNVLLKKLKIY